VEPALPFAAGNDRRGLFDAVHRRSFATKQSSPLSRVSRRGTNTAVRDVARRGMRAASKVLLHGTPQRPPPAPVVAGQAAERAGRPLPCRKSRTATPAADRRRALSRVHSFPGALAPSTRNVSV